MNGSTMQDFDGHMLSVEHDDLGVLVIEVRRLLGLLGETGRG